jgi:hypothetical protein
MSGYQAAPLARKADVKRQKRALTEAELTQRRIRLRELKEASAAWWTMAEKVARSYERQQRQIERELETRIGYAGEFKAKD